MPKKTPKKTTEVQPTVPTSHPTPTEPTTGIETAASAKIAAEPAKPRTSTVRKPEIVPALSRGSVVPINLDEEIRRLAYLLSERRGFQPGHEAEDWLNAEQQVLERYHQTSA